MKVHIEDIRGIVGIVPTPATADADQWDCRNSINFAQTQRMIEAVVSDGIEIVMTTGTFGEGATVTETELRDYVRCVVEAVNGRVPVFAGITTLNTRDTIRRGRELLDLGADGLFVGRPMWLPLDQVGIVSYYQDLAEAFRNVSLIVYDNPFAFKGKISREAYRELARIREVVASKHVGGPSLEDDLLAVGMDLRLLPLETDWCSLAQRHPDLATACWSGSVACAPAPFAALSRAILSRDWPRAEALTAKIRAALAPMFPSGDLEAFMTYSIQLGHARFNAAGLVDVGPCRPPYTAVPVDLLAGAEETGRMLARLQREMSGA